MARPRTRAVFSARLASASQRYGQQVEGRPEQAWIGARRRHRLSHAHVQMARELGLNPKKLGGMDNHHQEPWKVPLHQFIEQLYVKRFGRDPPEHVVSLEERARLAAEKRSARMATKAARAGDIEYPT